MKKRIVLLLALSPFFMSASYKDGDCQAYYALKKGVTMELGNFSAKDKLEGTTKSAITDVSSSGDTTVVSVHADAFDAKGKPTTSQNFAVKCCKNILYLSLSALADPKQVKPNATISGDFVDLPSNPTAGQQLKGGTMTISVGSGAPGMGAMNITSTITNRKVEALESKNTPAGTFDCIRISFDIATKVLFMNTKAHVVEWYAMGVGMVRSERYNDKNKLEGYSALLKISGN